MSILHQPESWTSVHEYDNFNSLAAAMETIRESLFNRHLVILRGAGSMSLKQFVALGEQLGEIEASLPGSPLHDEDGRIELLKRTEQDIEYATGLSMHPPQIRKPSSFFWHADRSFLAQPSFITVTRVMQTPYQGGDTDFLNTERAYHTLAEEEQEMLGSHQGIHSYAYYHRLLAGDVYTRAEVVQKEQSYPPAEHPLVLHHPITRQPLLYPSPLTLQSIKGPAPALAKKVLNRILYEAPNFYSHAWQQGDVVMWDNFGVLHRGNASQGPRELQRLTIALPE